MTRNVRRVVVSGDSRAPRTPCGQAGGRTWRDRCGRSTRGTSVRRSGLAPSRRSVGRPPARNRHDTPAARCHRRRERARRLSVKSAVIRRERATSFRSPAWTPDGDIGAGLAHVRWSTPWTTKSPLDSPLWTVAQRGSTIWLRFFALDSRLSGSHSSAVEREQGVLSLAAHRGVA